MKIGTDVSIAECRYSGYTVIEFKKRDLIKKGVLDKDCSVHVTISFPERWDESGRPHVGYESHELYAHDTCICWNSVYELYEQHKKSIDNFAGIGGEDGWTINIDNPNEYDLLNLIDVVSSYCGLE